MHSSQNYYPGRTYYNFEYFLKKEKQINTVWLIKLRFFLKSFQILIVLITDIRTHTDIHTYIYW